MIQPWGQSHGRPQWSPKIKKVLQDGKNLSCDRLIQHLVILLSMKMTSRNSRSRQRTISERCFCGVVPEQLLSGTKLRGLPLRSFLIFFISLVPRAKTTELIPCCYNTRTEQIIGHIHLIIIISLKQKLYYKHSFSSFCFIGAVPLSGVRRPRASPIIYSGLYLSKMIASLCWVSPSPSLKLSPKFIPR